MKKAFVGLICVYLWSSVAGLAAADWLHWRGPAQNGTATDTNLPAEWSPAKPGEKNLVWKFEGGGCRSTPLVQNGRVYVINKTGDGLELQERVMCLEADTGKLVWEYKFNVWHTDIVESRLGWTNLAGDAETGNVYAHGTQGLLLCFDKDGKVLWQRSLTEEFGRVTGYGGRVVSPTVDGDLVIVGMINGSWGDQARGGNRFVAFDKKTGTVVWWSDPCGQIKGTYYSVPVTATINGQRLFITGAADGTLLALQSQTGKRAWDYPVTLDVVNSSPVVDGNYVYITHGEENPEAGAKGRVVCVDASQVENGKPKLVWELKGEVEASYATPLIAGGVLYVADNKAKLYAFDAKTGKKLWRRPHNYGRLSRGSPVYADGKIYVFDVNAHFHILQPSAKDCKELSDVFFRSGGAGFIETNGTPAVANGRIYFGTLDELYCIGKPDAANTQARGGSVALGDIVLQDKTAKTAWVQVVPADVTVHPGEAVEFKARAFDANGNFIKEVKAEWSLPQPPPPPNSKTAPPALAGTIDGGKLTVAATPPSQQGYVEAKADGVAGRARVRVAPKLPYKQDFEKTPAGATPGGWVNTQGKFVVTEKDGSKVLKKLGNNPAPPVARANGYMTAATATGYTVQADLCGQRVRGKLPDMGVVANRYALILDGKQTKDDPTTLRLTSWDAQRRVNVEVPFPWKEETWYTVKFTVDLADKGGTVKGKVWPRGQKEPDAWTVTFADPLANREGAAALYGYVSNASAEEPGSEIFYDNVSVTPNAK